MKYYALSKEKRDILYEENIVYNELLKYKRSKCVKYVITKCSDCDSDRNTLNHELKHSEYYFNERYRKYIKLIWDTLDREIKEIVSKYLKSYHHKLHLDEF